MAEDAGQERTQEATQTKIKQAKEKGQFVRSQDITRVISMLAILIFFWLAQDYFTQNVLQMCSFFLDFSQFQEISPQTLPEFAWLVVCHFLKIVLPVLGLAMVAGAVAEVGQIGFQVLRDPFEPKWDKLDIVKGFSNLFSLKRFVEGAKAFFKMLFFGYVVFKTIREALPDLAVLNTNDILPGMKIMAGFGLKLGFRVCEMMIILAAVDYWYQRYEYYKNLRMTHQEVKEERKHQEGDPLIKSRIRSIQMEIARKRMMQKVPQADFIITNPTHYAVALQYDPAKDPAPMLTAKGQNFIALKIREVAQREGIPIIENPPLARALYKKGKVGHPIPADLFKAVAQLMASIWMLASKRGAAWAPKTPARRGTGRPPQHIPSLSSLPTRNNAPRPQPLAQLAQ